jgi:16S rRNA processing protein RimM
MKERVVVGIVRKTRGVHGELVIESRSDLPGRFDRLKKVYLVTPDRTRPITIANVRGPNDIEVWVRFEEITNREEAKLLRGATIEIDLTERPESPDGEYYYDELEGLEVRATSGELLGHVTAVIPRGGQDLYQVRTADGDVLIPATPEIIKSISVSDGAIVIDPPMGLLEMDDAY